MYIRLFNRVLSLVFNPTRLAHNVLLAPSMAHGCAAHRVRGVRGLSLPLPEAAGLDPAALVIAAAERLHRVGPAGPLGAGSFADGFREEGLHGCVLLACVCVCVCEHLRWRGDVSYPAQRRR